MFELILAVLIVVFTSAICSLFEAALYALPVGQVESMVQAGRRSGRILKKMREQIDGPITAILSLNTIANTAGATVVGALALRELGQESVIWVSVIMTTLILFLSEVLPKTVGVVYTRALAPVIAMPILVLVRAFRPLIWLCGLGTRIISGGDRQDEVSPEELTVMAHLAMQTGSIDKDAAEVIKNVLSVNSKTVREVMTPRTVLFTLSGQTTVAEALQDNRVYAHTRVPVYGETNEDIVGIIFRRDVLSAVAEEDGGRRLEDMTKPVHFVSETQNLAKVLKKFLDLGQHMFIVMDEFNGLAGVITLEDIIEEILGKEIVDEFDEVADLRVLARERRKELLHPEPERPKVQRPSVPKEEK